jgi:aldehyde:ferredoxin oxidoreductase
VDKLWKAGERIYNLRRAIMVLRENRHRDDDTISHVWFAGESEIDITTLRSLRGQTLSEPLDKEQWEALKDRYYRLRGWDVDTGIPGKAKLEELGMMDVADKLQIAGTIS